MKKDGKSPPARRDARAIPAEAMSDHEDAPTRIMIAQGHSAVTVSLARGRSDGQRRNALSLLTSHGKPDSVRPGP
eukprot:3480094-Rhodomonas_salina.1